MGLHLRLRLTLASQLSFFALQVFEELVSIFKTENKKINKEVCLKRLNVSLDYSIIMIDS